MRAASFTKHRTQVRARTHTHTTPSDTPPHGENAAGVSCTNRDCRHFLFRWAAAFAEDKHGKNVVVSPDILRAADKKLDTRPPLNDATLVDTCPPLDPRPRCGSQRHSPHQGRRAITGANLWENTPLKQTIRRPS